MCRFKKDDNKPENLNFDYNLYDGIRFDDNRTALITGYGIYDNQYWCEVCYPDGVHLGAGDYYSSDIEFYTPHIIGKISEEEKQHVIKEYIKALGEYPELYSEHITEIQKLVAWFCTK